MCSCLKLSPPPPISALAQPSLPSSFTLLSFFEFSVSVWAWDGWMESWQCLQMSHSIHVRPILLWREKLSEHTVIFVGLSSLTRQLLLRLPFMLQIIRQQQRLFKPNVNGWKTQTDTHPCDFSVFCSIQQAYLHRNAWFLLSMDNTQNANLTPHTNYKNACHSMRSLTPWQLWIKTRITSSEDHLYCGWS